MNFGYISRLTDEQTSKKLQDDNFVNDNIYNHLREIGPEEIDDLMQGVVVLGVELTNAPFVDGLVIYLKSAAAGLMAVSVNADEDDEFNILKCSTTSFE